MNATILAISQGLLTNGPDRSYAIGILFREAASIREMIDKRTQKEILRLNKSGLGLRSISKRLTVSRNTVRRISRRGSILPHRIPRIEKAHSWHNHVVDLLSSRSLTIIEVHRELLAHGFSVGFSTVAKYCRKHALRFLTRNNCRTEAMTWIHQLFQGAKSYEYYAKELPSLDKLEFLLGKIRTGSPKERKKACTILSRERGHSNRIIATVLNSSPKTTRAYYSAYIRLGLTHVFPSMHARNETVDGSSTRANRIVELLHHKPTSFDINRTSWSQLSLATAYEARFKESISRSTIARSLKGMRFVWKKAKRVLTSPDPNYREKVEILLAKLHSLGHNEQFFFLDELGPLTVKRRGGKTYVPRNSTPKCPRNQLSKGSVTLLGALSATTNQVTWAFGKSKDTSSIIDLIELLFNQYHDMMKIYITWDAVSWHNSIALLEWLDSFNDATKDSGKGPMIEVVPLPTSSQFLNVIEGVFSGMVRAVVHNSDYQSEEEMKLAISRHLCERNVFFSANPKRVGKRIWEADFFRDNENLRFGNYLE